MLRQHSKILLTGSRGTFGSHLTLDCDRPTHHEMDITGTPINWDVHNYYDLIVHAAAYTDVTKAESDKLECFKVNVSGTLNLLETYKESSFVFISSEYANNPVNFYSWTKKWAEELVEQHSAPYLIIRTLFKPSPWKYDKAFIDSWTCGDTVEIIAPLVEQAIMNWDRKTSKLIYIGTERKRIYDIAVKTKSDVIPNSINDIKNVKIPTDYL